MRNGMISAGLRQVGLLEDRIVKALVKRQAVIDAISVLDPTVALVMPSSGEALEECRLRAEAGIAMEDPDQMDLLEEA